MSASSSPLTSTSSTPKIPKLTWKSAGENEVRSAGLVKDDTWLASHLIHCPNNTVIRMRAGNRKYALSGTKEAFFDEKKKMTSDLVLFRTNRYSL